VSWTGIRSARAFTRAAAAAAVLAAVACAAIAPASAAPVTGPGFGAFGLTPSPMANGQPRPYFNLTVEPGHEAVDSVIATNLSARGERLRLTVSRGVTATNSGSAYENLTGKCTGPSCWISGLQHIVTLAPKEQLRVGFAVRVPRRVRPGQYLTGITLLAARTPKPVTVGKNGHASARAVIIEEVTVGVAVTIGQVSRLRTGLQIGRITSEWIGTTPRLNIPVRNTGQTFAHASGKLRCSAGGRSRTYPVIMETVLPGQSAVLAVNTPGLRAGSPQCQVSLLTASGHLAQWSGAVTLDSTTPTRTYHPASGVFVSVPVQTMPVWAIVLIVLGGLILLALLVLLGQRRRLTGGPGSRAR
jgi:hypothetical protein